MKTHKLLFKAKFLLSRLTTNIFILGICVLLYAHFIEPNWIDINYVELKLPNLASEFNGYRIVQISDIHIDKRSKKQQLNHIFRLVNQQKPDLIAITGDFVTRRQMKFISKLEATLGQLNAVDKIVAVLGNHDYWANATKIAEVLEKNNVLNLDNKVYTLKRGNSILNIAGVDDVWVGKDRLDLVLQQLPSEGAAILLAHEPDFADTSALTNRFDLQLSGHSHAGQINLPFLSPPFLPGLGQKYYAGLYKIGTMFEYTNRGIGTTKLHLRFGSRPEITVFRLGSGEQEV
ncbi:putative phosphohydrolase [Rivularia sp. PCC 7116]|uniref:metallophosphoesterase n=1 Tax=Rivularia sp. PCC 7116 TaxID=373994 RepID=UPI00029EF8DC|nr:metallophosphoesterase [Rivularia sp. PCC 7116]AFY58305.1 putative phosphohydrolase [Rivularia sp. PCC 7116]